MRGSRGKAELPGEVCLSTFGERDFGQLLGNPETDGVHTGLIDTVWSELTALGSELSQKLKDKEQQIFELCSKGAQYELYRCFESTSESAAPERILDLVVSVHSSVVLGAPEVEAYDQNYRNTRSAELFSAQRFDISENGSAGSTAHTSSSAVDGFAIDEVDLETMARELVDPEIQNWRETFRDFNGTPFRIPDLGSGYSFGVELHLSDDHLNEANFCVGKAGDESLYYLLALDLGEAAVVRYHTTIFHRKLSTCDLALLKAVHKRLSTWIRSLVERLSRLPQAV